MSNKDQTNLLNNLKDIAQKAGLDISEELAKINAKLESSTALSKTWERVELARHSDRPRTLDYINLIFDNFTELHGDRFFGDDPAMIGGIGFIDGMPVTVIGTQKGRNLRETIDRNGGMANPEGYRKAMRLAKQAEKFKRPIITFIDTQGAYPGLGAEERGIGEAIAFNLREFSRLKTPIICIIIGEGGSGGALGIGVGDKIYMLENAIFSVISPEGCASILLRDSSRAKDAAAMLKITSQEVLDLKVINGIIPEPEKGAHTDPKKTADAIKEQILKDLADLTKRDPAVLVKYRSKKIRSIGKYSE
ncbi:MULTISPECIES: acetyl-CoA carboxylase carboxyltransferase subunit alpha [Treponema]|jgi:acetyl-coA carboxylase, carboxyl transferase, alpha subunit|uniref:Acetyl-coenzyme A carboxylase carboxyl transferase subunit alpha n=3 Tax=Treponema denticola TaxID=158 RepID=ACCA_TREDE|nr:MULTISPECIES: acetyl-CoA carboxylase carboxyltransferase subunit alpha [Treponema]Q73Q55.1 RecName: Full=Acetyl-coenzyme A carboxylase carboxyl transferase subunit alpha; Short=ACCase subunit alpha; Short=Acetyl-CoA carboxylase carboxyltransferase subunit alpha [Treponema denticola ATCC 35405]AAS11084.1 acetyl-CoA carboxylase, carboxyl transferase, alpha subunit [Treponema denticola ATCC 35405]EMB26650.1 acetyl-coenzyme A carboxylase carboxyl transferase subunit alpha [Treponema denticola MYR